MITMRDLSVGLAHALNEISVFVLQQFYTWPHRKVMLSSDHVGLIACDMCCFKDNNAARCCLIINNVEVLCMFTCMQVPWLQSDLKLCLSSRLDSP